MKSGKRLKKSQLRKLLFAVCLCVIFVYANVTAETKTYKSESSILVDKDFLTAVVNDIENAKESIYLAIYMFKTDDKRRNDSELIKQALIRAAERGLHVEAVMDIAKKDDLTTKFNLDTGDELAEAGVIIRYDDVRQRMHAKTMVIDGRITYIGSHNYTHSALKYNDEITARIVSEGTAGETIEFIKSLN